MLSHICVRDISLDLSLSLDLYLSLDLSLSFSFSLDSKIRNSLQQLRKQIPDRDEDQEAYINWWRTNGENWAEKLRNVMIEYRNIGHDWQFSEEQRQLLRQYYDANQLLVECLKSDCYVSRDVRQYIEDTLLLPIAEIKPYR
ncbi:hypothetical protein IQ231_13915 [Cuspidothrix issatschenkoi LEGE 03284]|nr:hypothetical protein [Cuspidothrix issatschenkoi LEGE 03284]